MFLEVLRGGFLDSNCYVIGQGDRCVVIDPGTDARKITETANMHQAKIAAIYLTHAHIDHVYSLDALQEATHAPVYAHQDESDALVDAYENGSALFSEPKTYKHADVIIRQGDILNEGGISIAVLHTPGHTSGSLSFTGEGFVCTGDTLFAMSVGRTDLGRGDARALLDSIRNKLYGLSDQTIVYPGHGEATKIGTEKRMNPFT